MPLFTWWMSVHGNTQRLKGLTLSNVIELCFGFWVWFAFFVAAWLTTRPTFGLKDPKLYTIYALA